SYVPDVVRATTALLDRRAPYGTYHCVNSGCATWFELAQEIASQMGVAASIEPFLSSLMKGAARRPRFCALSNAKLQSVGVAMPNWQSAIGRHLAARKIHTAAVSGALAF